MATRMLVLFWCLGYKIDFSTFLAISLLMLLLVRVLASKDLKKKKKKPIFYP